MKTLYFDCFAGAAGDMILGGLVALGVEREKLVEQLKLLNLEGWEIDFETVNRSGISALKANVTTTETHSHRGLHKIKSIISSSSLNEKVKTRAIEIFTKLAEAEARVHGIEVEKVHFHEVGAIDAIIDIVGVCICFELLEIKNFSCSKIHVGSGFVEMQHGKFPVPPPAVTELLIGIPFYSTEISGELLTPTAAAIISTVCTQFGNLPDFQIEKVAYSAGSKNFKGFPNVLRLLLGETQERESSDQKLLKIETNIDDMSPEFIGFFMEKALAEGALDCWFTPIQMKKNRPASLLNVLCSADDREKMLDLFYTQTSTIGVRIFAVERHTLTRKSLEIKTEYGSVEVKIAEYKGREVNFKPEFESLRKVAEKNGISVKDLEREVIKIYQNGKTKS